MTSSRVAYQPPIPLGEAERDYVAALEWLLKCAVNVGKGEAGAIIKAKRARQSYQQTVAELGRAERKAGRTGSIQYIHVHIGLTR